MNANFFSPLAALNLTGDLQLTISKGADNNLIVSIMLLNEQCGDDAKKLIPPLNLRGTAEELDNGFFERISTPVQTVSGLMVNMEAFMKQLEEAKKRSAIEKEKSDKEKKAKDEKDKKFKDAMTKVDELVREGKFREAWIKVPDPALFPEQAETIRRRKAALSAKFAPDLFAVPERTATIAEPSPENTLFDEDPDGLEDEFEEDNEEE